MTGIGALLFAIMGALILFGVVVIVDQKYNDLLNAIKGNKGSRDKKK